MRTVSTFPVMYISALLRKEDKGDTMAHGRHGEHEGVGDTVEMMDKGAGGHGG